MSDLDDIVVFTKTFCIDPFDGTCCSIPSDRRRKAANIWVCGHCGKIWRRSFDNDLNPTNKWARHECFFCDLLIAESCPFIWTANCMTCHRVTVTKYPSIVTLAWT